MHLNYAQKTHLYAVKPAHLVKYLNSQNFRREDIMVMAIIPFVHDLLVISIC
jgi:hypothetical protein